MAESCETIDLLLLDYKTERSLSTQLLYKFFANNLRLGQWELARACISTLVQRDDKLIAEILKDIIEEPLAYCDGSHSVPTPFHLSWLCLQELHKYYDGKVELPESIQKKIEFRLLLQSCSSEDISLQCLQELDYYHSQLVVPRHGQVLQKVPSVDSSWLKPLKDLVHTKPRIAHAIIQCLLGSGAEFAGNNAFFQTLYLDVIMEHLRKLSTLEVSLKTVADFDNLNETEQGTLNMHKSCCDTIHQLLVAMEPQSDTAEIEVEELLMSLLYKVQSIKPSEEFSKGSIYSALLSHSSHYLFQKFCNIENDWQLGSCSSGSQEPAPSATLFVPSETILTRSCGKDRPEAWKLLYFHARQNHHILEDVVKSCVEFVRLGDMDKVTEILSCQEFSPMKVLVLLLAWPYCHSCDSAQKLLDILWDSKKPSKHLLLDQACAKLEYQVHLVKWCLDKAKPLVAATETPAEDHEKAYEMFQSLDSHSILHVLHQSTNLCQLPENEVLDMLRTRPVFSSTPCVSQNDSTLEEDSSQSASFDERFEIQRDVALYHGFCALRSFMEAVMANLDEEGGSTCNVGRKIHEAQDHVDNIFPLTFRVEVLENVFSLLFVSSEQLIDDLSQAVESDDLETLESRSLRSSRTASIESFLSVDSKNTSPWKPNRTTELGSEFSPSRTTSPELLRNIHVENSPENQPGFRETDRDSTQKISEELRGQQDVSNLETMVACQNRPKLGTRSVRVRELQFGEVTQVTLPNKDTGEPFEVFQLPFEGASKDKLLELSERKMKGLLVDKTLLGELLEVLKKCLKDVLSLKADQNEQGKNRVHAEWIKTSVSMTTLEQRISRLGQYVNEAQWRYQLVSTCCNGNESDDEVPDDQVNISSDGDSDVEQELSMEGKRSEDLPELRKRKIKLTKGRLFEKALTSGPGASIPRLLCSPGSLINMCMKIDNYTQAKHIIKLFNFDDNESSKAVLFAEEYENAFQRLTQLEKSKTKDNLTAKSPTKKRRLSILKNVASAAAAGIASISPASIIEGLLLSSSIDLTSSGLTLVEPAHAHFVYALVCLDFLCTGQISKQSCPSLLEIAKQKMDLGIEIEPSTPYTLRCIAEFLSNLESLLNDDCEALATVDSLFGDIKPLNAKTVKTHRELQAQQDVAFTKLEEAIEDGDTVIKSITENPTTEMPALIKFKKMEHKTAVRIAMIEFQNAFDCHKDGRLIVVRRSEQSAQYRLEYIQSLYNHVNMLSTWELYWKMNSKERNSIQLSSQKPVTLKATNPFLVLTQGFDDLAGKPLFERNVPPKSMESMCRKMNVDLIRIIVHNCCPVIPAFGPSQRNGPVLSSTPRVVLNDPINDDVQEISDPVSFAQILLTKLKELLQGMKDPETGIVDLQSLLVLSSSPSYFVLLKEIRKLSWVDLNELTSDDVKICFFTNVLNILLTHAAITELSQCSSAMSGKSGRNISEGSNSEDHSSGSTLLKQYLPRLDASYIRTLYLKKYGYNIGQLGFISAFELWFTFLRVGLHTPANVQNISLCSQVSHCYQKYQPRKSDFRLTFVICDGTISAPEIQVLSTDDLQSQLDDGMSNYLSNTVKINVADEKIFLPELLEWYRKDLTVMSASPSNAEPGLMKGNESENWVDLLLRISPYLRGDQFKTFDDMAPQLNVTFIPHCWSFGFLFLSPEILQQRHEATPEKTTATLGRPKYTLTQTLSSYLMARSPLVASLANLSCAQDSSKSRGGEQQQASTADIPSLLTSFANTSTTHSLEVASPFEFAMNQTAKFPVLQRHITCCFYSVLKFLYLGGLGLVQPASSQSSLFGSDLSVRNQSRLFLLDESSLEVSDVFLRAVNYSWQKGDWELLLEIFNSGSLREHGRLRDPGDFVLELAFQSGVQATQDDDIAAHTASTLRDFGVPAPNFDLNWKKKRWLLLYRIKDDYLRTSIVLQCLHNWTDVHVCLNLLNFCCSKPPRDSEMLQSLRRKAKQVNLCKKIMECHSTRGFDASKMEFENWKDVVEQSIRKPEAVVQALLSHERFDLVREWMEIYSYPSNLRQKIHEEYLKHLFKKIPVDITQVYMYLEEINDPSKTLMICESLLSKAMAIPNVVFLVHFMITELDSVLKPERKRELRREKLGASALLCIPELNRRPYKSLVSQPLLLLEQLLMDIKVDWAAKMFGDLQAELTANHNYDESLRKEISVDAFEKLLVTYASKALQFEVVAYKETDNSLSYSASGKQSSSTDSRNVKTSTPIKKHQRHASFGAAHPSLRSFGSSLEGAGGSFTEIPEQVPGEEDWEPDYKHSVCMICKDIAFNMFVRRHHCRRCGRVVCDACSPFKRVLENYGRTPVRVCKDCDKMMYEESFKQKEVHANLHTGSLPTHLSKNAEGNVCAGFGDRAESVVKSDDEFNFDDHNGWKLTLNDECNEVIRAEFLYEQAPSSSLCTSILALHSNSKSSAKLLLELCNRLSQKLGLSEEIDNNLLISIICQLLLHAKLKFTNCGETQGVELCDTYMSRVELVKFLIESNFYELPSIEDLMTSQTARRLRDRLIENESLSLAMEVTTKCGLDPGAVWGAWGLAYLQVGKFKEARQKFGKFLKPSDRGKATQGNISYLKMIVDILESSPMISFDYLTVGDLDASLTSLREHAKNSGGARNLDPKRFDECIFYLNTYGSYAGVVSFYVNHNHLKLACRFILEKRCAPDIFTESLLMPAIRNGQFEMLRDLLKMFDPTLEVWIPHLNGSCRYLSRSNYLNVLYQVQLLMKDYFRAAVTCIKFYQGLPHHPAITYSDLNSRSHYLQDAKTHLDAVRKHQQSKKGTLSMVANSLQLNMGDSSEDKTRMNVTPTELTNYINAITLQIEVTKFMQNCYIEGTLRKPKGERKKLGTLFDNANIKCDVVSEVLLAGSTVDDGFSLACRIIQDFRLPAVTVYKKVADKLAAQQKFNEIQILLTSAIQTRLMIDKDHDGVIIGVLGTLAGDDRKWKQAETLIKLLKDEGKKVASYMKFGRLRTAYLIAVAGERVEDVKAIARIAKQTEQTKVHNICVKWLDSNAKKKEKQDVFPALDWEGV